MSQIPQALKYKAIAKDEWGLPLPRKDISLCFSVLLGDSNGELVYQEVHYTKTTPYGLMDVNIGEGTRLYGYFDEIDWSAGNVSNKDDADADPANELQILSLSENQLSLSQSATLINLEPYLDNTDNQQLSIDGHTLVLGAGGSLQLPDSANDADHDPLNELQELAFEGTILSISGKNTVDLAVWQDGVNDADANPTNELQVLSIRGDTIFLSEGGWVKLPEPVSLNGNIYYGDQDSDGFGDKYKLVWLPEQVTLPAGFVPNPADCNDNNSTINPNAVEIEGDGIDNDCDGEIDEIYIQESEPVIDIDGNIYTIIKISTQEWMKENLKTTKFNNGSDIPQITDNIEWCNLTSPGYCWYNNLIDYKSVYGAYYNFYCIDGSSLCPIGWHVPSNEEWNILINNLIANGFNYDVTFTSNKIVKSLASTSLWFDCSTIGAIGNSDFPEKRNATNFTALSAGKRNTDGNFVDRGFSGNW